MQYLPALTALHLDCTNPAHWHEIFAYFPRIHARNCIRITDRNGCHRERDWSTWNRRPRSAPDAAHGAACAGARWCALRLVVPLPFLSASRRNPRDLLPQRTALAARAAHRCPRRFPSSRCCRSFSSAVRPPPRRFALVASLKHNGQETCLTSTPAAALDLPS